MMLVANIPSSCTWFWIFSRIIHSIHESKKIFHDQDYGQNEKDDQDSYTDQAISWNTHVTTLPRLNYIIGLA